VLNPQNGDHIVTIDSVTSLHRIYNICVHRPILCLYLRNCTCSLSKFCANVAHNRASVSFRQCCNMSCTSCFLDDVLHITATNRPLAKAYTWGDSIEDGRNWHHDKFLNWPIRGSTGSGAESDIVCCQWTCRVEQFTCGTAIKWRHDWRQLKTTILTT